MWVRLASRDASESLMGMFKATIRIKVAALLKSNTVTMSTVSIFSLNMVYHRFQCFRAVNCPVCQAGTLSLGPGKAVFQAIYKLIERASTNSADFARYLSAKCKLSLLGLSNAQQHLQEGDGANNLTNLPQKIPLPTPTNTTHQRRTNTMSQHSIANHIETLTV